MIKEAHLDIPVYDTKTNSWSIMSFKDREEFLVFLWSIFKEPGLYNFDSTTVVFNEQSRLFTKNKVYCTAPFKSKDFISYWDDQKSKSRKGVIVLGEKETWYLSREYYFWLNFLPIYDKEKGKFDFPSVRDAQYHMQLYEMIAKLSYKHAAILKKRQIASSYFHAAAIVNHLWFEEGFVAKMAGSLKDYINEKGTWRFLEEYRNFLNVNTAWYRPFNPDKVLNWEQKIEVTQGGRKRDVGLKSALMGLVLEKDPTNGVGGPCGYFFHEEAGIAPKMNQTLEYLLPALKSGMIYTGFFVASGSVGDLDQCEPLRDLIMRPSSKDVLAVKSTLLNSNRDYAETGLFIPEQWSMPPYMDEWGNSLVEEAMEAIIEERKQWVKELTPDDYQLRISQKPMFIEEAFATRNAPKFPPNLINSQLRRILDKEYFTRYVDIFRNEKNEIEFKDSKKLPISEFPISPKTIDKEGVIVIHEEPIKDLRFGSYIASIDPVGEGRTTTSESLCAIYIYRLPIEITKTDLDGKITSEIKRGKLVAHWCGRFDDISKTHERLELLIEAYNAWALIESNVSLFIQHMISKKKQKYLVPKSQILFLKDLHANTNVFQEYGWRNVGTMFKGHLLNYAIEHMKEEVDIITKPDGEIVKIHYAVEEITDPMLLKEMAAYTDKLNVDRLVAWCALIAFVKMLVSNLGFVKKREQEEDKTKKISNKNDKLIMTPFRHIGGNSSFGGKRIIKHGFKNLR